MPFNSRTPGRRSLLRQRDFASIWWAGAAVFTTSNAMFVVLPMLVYERTRSPLATAMTVLAWALPPATIGQLAGVVADRLDRRRLLIAATATTAILSVGYLAVAEQPWWALALLSLLIGCAGQFKGPAEHALIPEVVPRDRWGEGAGLNALNNNIGRLLGPAAGGVLYATTGLTGFIIAKVALECLSVLLLLRVSRDRPFTPPPRTTPERRAWRAGARVVWRHRRLRIVAVLLVIVAFGEGFISALLAPLIDEMLGGGADTLGIILSAQAIGGLVGAWWASRIMDRADPLTLMGITSLIGAVLLGVVLNYGWFYPVVWPAVVFTALVGVPFAIFGGAQVLALQRYAPARMRGRVFALLSGVMSLASVVAIGIAGIAGERWGPVVINVDTAAYLVAGAIAVCVAMRASRRAHRRTSG